MLMREASSPRGTISALNMSLTRSKEILGRISDQRRLVKSLRVKEEFQDPLWVNPTISVYCEIDGMPGPWLEQRTDWTFEKHSRCPQGSFDGDGMVGYRLRYDPE